MGKNPAKGARQKEFQKHVFDIVYHSDDSKQQYRESNQDCHDPDKPDTFADNCDNRIAGVLWYPAKGAHCLADAFAKKSARAK